MIDLLQRFNHLTELSEDPLIINEDGTRVDPLLEIAAEIAKKPRRLVTFEERNAVMVAIRMAQAPRRPGRGGNPFTASGGFAGGGAKPMTDKDMEDFLNKSFDHHYDQATRAEAFQRAYFKDGGSV